MKEFFEWCDNPDLKAYEKNNEQLMKKKKDDMMKLKAEADPSGSMKIKQELDNERKKLGIFTDTDVN